MSLTNGGLRQGCTLSSVSFNTIMDNLLRKLDVDKSHPSEMLRKQVFGLFLDDLAAGTV